ncbi:putative sugar uptake ABC transporter periplasmic solute-binding protein precursor [Xylanimonas cellulosilytica DSM 15894]|uniref:Sugar uptake ABC transporter periplasmic solute-binding protein n=1 Tax=Xylanimonas cellulosilytica (strain DSM 15894 / JCM 12276 / CECT 5975 / KCTC 9989 / LMG 20990 / NBRC 107835 / XIL07) TaxID=446471 RepID=D1BUQ7_XYLCX|nr:sugar-binding protein [Xylanimonas cellulosilytica]ACZ29298.1 putative sugar uptake ABC transporter periplasmic solute-binding protein precursor [Xylanimonas cellulosilytica DSM 15894]
MKKFKTGAALAAVAMAGAFVLSGCGEGRGSGDATDAAAADGAGFAADAVIGVSLPQQTSENWVLAEDLFNDGLSEAGFEPIVQFANAGVGEQQNQVQAMIERGAEVIVIGAVDGAQLGTQLEAAHAAGITVIAYDRMLTQTPDVDLYVAFDNFQVGVLQGTALLEGLEARKAGASPWNIELIAGSADDANSTPFFEGAMSILQPKIDDGTLNVVSGQTTFDQVATAGWLADNAQRRMDTLLSGFYNDGTELHGVLSPNDTLARAALTAVDSAGLDVPVVTGQDSEVESVRSIMQGIQYSTIYKDTRELVAETIRQVQRAQAGDDFESNDTVNNGVQDVPTFFLPPVIVTQENAVEVFAGDPILEPVMSEFE